MSQTAEVYAGLRSRVLTTNPNNVGIMQSDSIPNVWGVMMEFQISGTVVTLVSLADGTTSIYFSNGGGFIGGGQHEEVATATKEFIALAESLYEEMSITTEYPLPKAGRVKFYVLTFPGIYTVDPSEDELVNNSSRFSSLFTAGNEVIAQVRRQSTPSE